MTVRCQFCQAVNTIVSQKSATPANQPDIEVTNQRLSRFTLVIYTLPVVGVGYMSGMLLFYLLKFATDVLLIAPGAMGAIFDTPCKAKTKGWSECGFLVPHR